MELASGPSRLAGAAAAAALLLAGACGPSEPARAPAPAGTIQELRSEASVTTEVNARAPAFVRRDFAGELVRTQDAVGERVILLDFWSVFCQSCLQEMPFLRTLHERYAPEGLQVIGVNTDFFNRERIEKFMEKTGLALPYPLIHDRDQSLAKLFSVEALPVLVLIDAEGWIRMVHLGYRPADEGEIESRVRRACARIHETVVTLQPVGGTTAFAPPEKGRALLAPGASVDDFAAIDTAGGAFSFAAWRGGSPALVLFWSVFCQPCRRELPALAELARDGRLGAARVLAVNVDAAKLRPVAERTLAAAGGGLTGVFDSMLEDGRLEVAGRFGVGETPSTFLLDGEGTVRAAWAGEVGGDELAAAAAQAAGAGGKP